MCRLFGMISPDKTDCTEYLVDAECSLLKQSNCNKNRLQKDGWGIGYYLDDSSPKIIKSPNPVFNEKERFKRACKRAISRIVLAHIRAASNPRHLPYRKLISISNTQPFFTGKYIFVHNGTITIPDEVTESLGEYKRNIMGNNDSELLFWLFMKNLPTANSIQTAFSMAVSNLWTVWDESSEKVKTKVRKNYGISAPYIGLNCLITDGTTLCAFCKHDETTSRKSLCYGDQPYFQLCYTIFSNRLIIASEKINRKDDWHFLENGQFLHATVRNERLRFSIRKLPATAVKDW